MSADQEWRRAVRSFGGACQGDPSSARVEDVEALLAAASRAGRDPGVDLAAWAARNPAVGHAWLAPAGAFLAARDVERYGLPELGGSAGIPLAVEATLVHRRDALEGWSTDETGRPWAVRPIETTWRVKTGLLAWLGGTWRRVLAGAVIVDRVAPSVASRAVLVRAVAGDAAWGAPASHPSPHELSSKWWPDGVPVPFGGDTDVSFAEWRYGDVRWTDLLLLGLDPETRAKVEALAERSVWTYVRRGGGSSPGVVRMQFGSALVMDPGGRLRPAEPGEADRLIGFAGEEPPRAP